MNPNRAPPPPPPLVGYSPARGYGLDSGSRIMTPYPTKYGPNMGHGMQHPPPSSSGSMSAYRMDAMPGPDRRDPHHMPSPHHDQVRSPYMAQHRPDQETNHASPAHKGKKRPASGPDRPQGRASNASAVQPSTSKAGAQVDSPEADDGQKRKKKAVSCEGCRRRKLKCDRGWPCGACRDRDEAHLCSWEGGTRPQATGRDQDNVPLMLRMDKMEMLLGKIADQLAASSSKGGGDVRPLVTAPVESSVAPIPAVNGQPGYIMRNMSSGLYGICSKPITEDQMTSELLAIMKELPDTETVRKLCHCFFEEVNWMQYTVDEDSFWLQLRDHEELRMMVSSGNSKQVVSKEHVRDHLQFLALILSVCGFALLFSDESEHAEVVKMVGAVGAYGPFLDASYRAFNATNPFENPTVLSVRVLILLMQGYGFTRAPAVGHALLASAVSLIYALELDVEPAPTMTKAQARDRIRLFHTLVVMDWFGAGTVKRSYLIREEPIKHPYLFGRQNVKEGLSEKDGILMPDMWLKLEVARINRRAADRANMTEEESYSTTLQLQQEMDEIFADLPPEFEGELQVERTQPTELDMATFHRLAVMIMVANQLINLHKRYYIQGWLNPAFRTSRDICFSSARRICLLFRVTFSYTVALDTLMTMDMEQIQKMMEGRQKMISRLWYFAHCSVGACLLLQHHYALMDVHPEAAGPNVDKVRAEIIDDLRYTRRLLLAMSARSQIARSGIAALSRPDMGSGGSADVADFQQAKALTSGRPSACHADGDEDLSNRDDLTRDLQSITDHDSFAIKRLQRMHGRDSLLNFRRRNHRDSSGGGSGHDAATSVTSQTNDDVTPASTPSLKNLPIGAAQSSQMWNRGVHPADNGSVSAVNGEQQRRTPFPSYGKSAMSNTINANTQLAQIEAFLESTLSNDMSIGLPLAPESSFERQADRMGEMQPFVSNAMTGPLSPFTSAFLGSWDAMQQQHQQQHQAGAASQMVGATAPPTQMAAPVMSANGAPTSAAWFS